MVLEWPIDACSLVPPETVTNASRVPREDQVPPAQHRWGSANSNELRTKEQKSRKVREGKRSHFIDHCYFKVNFNSTPFGKYLCDLRWFMYYKDEGIKSGGAISCGPKCSGGWQRRGEVVDEELSFQDKQEVSAFLKALSG